MGPQDAGRHQRRREGRWSTADRRSAASLHRRRVVRRLRRARRRNAHARPVSDARSRSRGSPISTSSSAGASRAGAASTPRATNTGCSTIGDPEPRADRLRAVSPADHASKIKMPVLLVHGWDDRVVPFSQSEDHESSSRKVGAQDGHHRPARTKVIPTGRKTTRCTPFRTSGFSSASISARDTASSTNPSLASRRRASDRLAKIGALATRMRARRRLPRIRHPSVFPRYHHELAQGYSRSPAARLPAQCRRGRGGIHDPAVAAVTARPGRSRPIAASTSRRSASAAWAARTCTRLSSQNIVALCDVDWSYVDRRFGEIPAALDQARQRLAQATDDVQRGRQQTQIDGWLELAAQAAEGEALRRLPRDAREAEGHRRGGDRDAGSRARGA